MYVNKRENLTEITAFSYHLKERPGVIYYKPGFYSEGLVAPDQMLHYGRLTLWL